MKDDKFIEKEIEEIMGCITCTKNFKCYKSGYKNLCKAQNSGLDSYLVCLEEDPQDCKFALSFGYFFFCQCPMRVYLAKKQEK